MNNHNQYHDEHHRINMHDQTAIDVTVRDRLMRAWEDTMEHARDYSKFAIQYKDTPEGDLFRDAAEKQGLCAAMLHDRLLERQENGEEN